MASINANMGEVTGATASRTILMSGSSVVALAGDGIEGKKRGVGVGDLLIAKTKTA